MARRTPGRQRWIRRWFVGECLEQRYCLSSVLFESHDIACCSTGEVHTADLDGDGDVDILATSGGVVWYENTDGDGSFSTGTDITSSADGAKSVYAADLDGDGDIDVLSGSYNDDRVVWYENLDRRVTELKSDDIFNFFMNAFALAIEPHTAYLSPRGSDNFEISMKLSLEGIGALLGRESEYTSIARVVPGGPAALPDDLDVSRIVTAAA